MLGYDENFLGLTKPLPLPTFSTELEPRVLRDPTFQNGYYTRYIHYSVATNIERRQPIVAALNIEQSKIRTAKRSDWSLDPRVGVYQLDNDYYYRNAWDRGHLARRSSAAWGDTDADAKKASDATMTYANSALQHENFNQDEWLELEDWVKNLTSDSNNKITVFSGPIYGSQNVVRRFVTPLSGGGIPAEVPTGFFKVVCFVDKKGEPATRAFVLFQDKEALSDKNGKSRNFDLGTFQVPIKLIEDETGLRFAPEISERNPILFDPPQNLPSEGSGELYPQIVPCGPSEICDGNEPPMTVVQNSRVFIIAAMINATGYERSNEWVTIFNLSNEEVNLSGWKLSDSTRKPLQLSGTVAMGEAKRIQPLAVSATEGVVLGNNHGVIQLVDSRNRQHDRVVYSSRTHRIREGEPLMFHIKQ